ncbi:hypothetical protein TNCT_304171 [Trichonephila clavata]|uniref:Secreted protein n=1 Tax=Trichonephila clavata TaxID=2740835 RepID=A0A8X6LU81_TRICU|nr:hypothetical protein TNCT_304171 [Trichonephila clavata]
MPSRCMGILSVLGLTTLIPLSVVRRALAPRISQSHQIGHRNRKRTSSQPGLHVKRDHFHPEGTCPHNFSFL